VAIALPPENDYQVFVERVRRKLNLAGVAGIYHAEVRVLSYGGFAPANCTRTVRGCAWVSGKRRERLTRIQAVLYTDGAHSLTHPRAVSPSQTNIPVHNLAELQDIDDLVVEEGTPPPPTDGHVRSSPAAKGGSASARKSGSLARTPSDAEGGRGKEEEEEDDDKYAKKGNPLYRLFVQVAPENMVRGPSSGGFCLVQRLKRWLLLLCRHAQSVRITSRVSGVLPKLSLFLYTSDGECCSASARELCVGWYTLSNTRNVTPLLRIRMGRVKVRPHSSE
jgi:hypothetical protein